MLPNTIRAHAQSPYSSLNAWAIHTVGNIDYPVTILADAEGHLIGTKDTWVVQTSGSALANNKQHLTLFNAAGSGIVIHVNAIMAQKDWAAVTGVAWQLAVRRVTSAGTGGSALTIASLDTQQAALPAAVTATNNASTPTESTTIYTAQLHSEETNQAAALREMFPIWPVAAGVVTPDLADLVIRAGQGMTLKQLTNTTAGTYYFTVLFTTHAA
jgi:hypothetical protein